MLSPSRRLKNIQRVRKIIGVFVKYGFRDLIYRLPQARRLIPSKVRSRILKGSSAERLRLALEELGGTFVKSGQILSVRTDILSEDFTLELSKLQDEVEPIPYDEVKDVIQDELNAPISELFTSFKKESIAAASLAQVHQATTVEDEKVVVKVQRPNVKETLESDLSILKTISRWVENEIPETRQYEPMALAEELERNLKREVRFTEEGRSMDRFRENFRFDDSVVIPKVYWDLTAEKVLTMQYIEGQKITNPSVPEKIGISKKEIVKKGVDFVFEQIFNHHFFHADPHPGNLLITNDGKISMLDFGLMGKLDDETMEILSDLMIAGTQKNVDRIMETLLELEVTEREVNKRELRSDIRFFLDKYYGISLHKIDTKDVSDDLFRIARKYGLKIPRDLVLLAKTLSTLEGVVNQLDPEFNIIEELKPHVESLIRKRYDLLKLLGDLKKILRSYFLFLKKLPDDLTTILRRAKDGSITVKFEHRGLGELIVHSEKSANRLSLSLIIAALIVGSALIIQTGKLFTFGIVGFVITGILGMGLIIAALRSGRF
ncbi:MAG: AarF/ABC1/UbiB kinase family protein [candidate division WOR-3 bacterium]|nr:AarF/ABC1/UbiB kinase family protein [candidate division WOR-3 bacterium]